MSIDKTHQRHEDAIAAMHLPESDPRPYLEQVFLPGDKTKDVLLTGRRATACVKVQKKLTVAWKEERGV